MSLSAMTAYSSVTSKFISATSDVISADDAVSVAAAGDDNPSQPIATGEFSCYMQRH